VNDYHVNIYYSEKQEGYVADIPDLEIYSTPYKTPAEALAAVQQAKEQWIAAAIADQRPIPEVSYHSNTYDRARVGEPRPAEARPLSEDQPSYEDDLEYIKKRIAEHECILFLGSAIHVPPPPELPQYQYSQEKAPPIGNQLSRILAEKCDYPGADWWNLQRVSQYFESKTRSRYRLVEEIKDAVHENREPSPILRMLADLEFPIVITTNYDHLYERALEDKAKAENITTEPYQVSVYNPNIKKKVKTADCARTPDPKQPYILKIHGDVDTEESIVLTDEDYIQFVLRMSDKPPYHPFGNNVLAQLTRWPTLFVGYSLMDYNLRLLFKTLRWKLDAARIPPTYSVDKKPDVLIRDVWENQQRYVSFIVLNLWDCIPRLHDELCKGKQT
jgi:predicted RNase H-like HicB family nuclease